MVSKDLTFNLFGRDVNATASMRRVTAAAEESSRGMKRAFGELPKFAALAVAGAGIASVKMAADFQQASTRLVTDAGESASKLGMVKAGMLDISSATGTSAKDIAGGMYLIESAGFHGAAGLQVMRAAAEGAKIGMADQKTVADALTTTMTDYNFKGKDAALVMSQLTATVSTGKTNMEALAGSLHSVLPAAASAKISLQEVLGAVGTMTQEGISADQATQNLNHAIASLSSPSMVAQKEMAQMGLTSLDVSQHLGQRGLTGTFELLNAAIVKHMGKSGLVIQSAMNQSKVAAASARQEMEHFPPALKTLATEFLNNTITQKQWTKGIKDLPIETANLGRQFAVTAKRAHGFSDLLKSGGGTAQTYNAAMEKMTGGMTGLQVALHLTGDHLNTFKANVKTVGSATAEAGGHVRGWADTQKGFNVQLGIAVKSFENMGIGLGSALLPSLTQVVMGFSGFAKGLRDGNGAAIAVTVAIGSIVGALTAVYVAQRLYAAGAMLVQGAMGLARIATLAWRGVLLLLKLEVIAGQLVLQGWMAVVRLAAAAQAFFIDGLLKSGIAWTVSTAKTIASTVAMGIQKAAMIAGTVVTWAAAAATTAFGVAMDIATGPIGLIILGVAALIAGIILLVTHWKEVCAFLQVVWGAVCKWFADTIAMFVHNWTMGWGLMIAAAKMTLNEIHDAVTGVIGTIRDFFAGAAGWLVDAGKNIISGLINGITGAAGAVMGAIGNLASGVVNTFKNLLGIHSPSVVFHNFGTFIGQGLSNGILGSQAQVQAATAKLSATVIGMFEKKKGGLSSWAEQSALGTIGSGTRELMAEAARRASIAKQIVATQKTLTSELAAQKKAENSSLKSSTMGAASVTSFAAPGDAIQGLRKLVTDTGRFKTDLQKLSKMGIDPNTFSQLVQAGVSGGGLTTADQLVANPTDFRQIVALQRQLETSATGLASFAGQQEYAPQISATRAKLASLNTAQRVETWRSQRTAANMTATVARETHVHVHLSGTYVGTKTDLARTVTQAIRDEKKKGTISKDWNG